MKSTSNIDLPTVRGFGEEWQAFDQSDLPEAEAEAHFNAYFASFRWDLVGRTSEGFDMGCGSGRWAKLLAPKVKHLHCIDPSEALNVARRNLGGLSNVSFHQAAVDNVPLPQESMDFGVSLGVLHHIPNTAAAIRSCVRLLKPGAPFLLYLYYRFDNQPIWYRTIWRASDVVRRIISLLPRGLRIASTSLIAACVYWPFARLAKIIAAIGVQSKSIPLSYYRDASFYTMRTDALDRFGTRLEQRFTKAEIEKMLTEAGCTDIRFSDKPPFWCACAVRNG